MAVFVITEYSLLLDFSQRCKQKNLTRHIHVFYWTLTSFPIKTNVFWAIIVTYFHL
jgi:hypothetical protein